MGYVEPLMEFVSGNDFDIMYLCYSIIIDDIIYLCYSIIIDDIIYLCYSIIIDDDIFIQGMDITGSQFLELAQTFYIGESGVHWP